MIHRKRAGGLVLGVFLLAVVALVIIALTARGPRGENLLSSRVLLVVTVGLVLAALAWMTQIVRTYALARPRGLDPARRIVGVAGGRAVPAHRQPVRLRRAAGQLPTLPVGQPVRRRRRHVGGRGDHQAAAQRADGRQRRRSGPHGLPHRHDDAGQHRHDDRPHHALRAPPQHRLRPVPAGQRDGREVPQGLPRRGQPAIGRLPAQRGLRLGPRPPPGRADRPHREPRAEPAARDRRLHARRRHRLLRRGQHGGLGLDHRRGRRCHRRRRAGAAAHRRRAARRPARQAQRLRAGGRTAPRRRPGAVVRPLAPRLRRLQPHGPPALPPAEHCCSRRAPPTSSRTSRTSQRPPRTASQRTSRRRCSPRWWRWRGQALTLQSISFDPNLPDPTSPTASSTPAGSTSAYMRQVVQNAFAAPAPAPPPTTTQAPPPTASRRAGATATPTPTVAPTAAPAQLACGGQP